MKVSYPYSIYVSDLGTMCHETPPHNNKRAFPFETKHYFKTTMDKIFDINVQKGTW